MLREKEPNGALEQALGHLYQSENVPAGYETGWRAAVKTGGEQDETRGKQHKTTPLARHRTGVCSGWCWWWAASGRERWTWI